MNLFKNINLDQKSEEFIEILKRKDLRIERIVSTGQSSPKDFWYDQQENEFVCVLEGEAILEFEAHDITLQKGDCYEIKAHQKHRVKYTSQTEPTIWLAIFY